jgi:hypothetical protein
MASRAGAREMRLDAMRGFGRRRMADGALRVGPVVVFVTRAALAVSLERQRSRVTVPAFDLLVQVVPEREIALPDAVRDRE